MLQEFDAQWLKNRGKNPSRFCGSVSRVTTCSSKSSALPMEEEDRSFIITVSCPITDPQKADESPGGGITGGIEKTIKAMKRILKNHCYRKYPLNWLRDFISRNFLGQQMGVQITPTELPELSHVQKSVPRNCSF